MDHLDDIRSVMRKFESLELGGIRNEQLRRRVSNFARRVKIEDESILISRLRQDASLRAALMDALTINVTSVFRNADSWDVLRTTYLPGLGKRIRVWSAGASTGAEAYTMAIIAKENGQHVDILASDIDERSLAKAKVGRYPNHEMKEIPPDLKRKYFTEDGDGWVVDPRLRARIRFKRHDLLAEPIPGNGFDLIACRNVVIYFSKEAQRDLHARMAQALRPGGILFIGGAERVADPRQIGLEPLERTFYMRKASAMAVAI